MHNDSYEDKAPDQFTRDYGIGGNEDSDSDYYSCPMPLWGKMIWLTAILGGGALLYELVRGNRAVMIFMGCTIAIVAGFFLEDKRQSDDDNAN